MLGQLDARGCNYRMSNPFEWMCEAARKSPVSLALSEPSVFGADCGKSGGAYYDGQFA